MRKIAAIIFFSVYFISVIKPYLPLLNYSFNKKQIVSRYCENKDKPQLHCEGKCHLKKELKKASKEDAKIPQVFKVPIEQITESVYTTILCHPVTSILENVLINNYLKVRVCNYSPKVFEPPRHT